MTDSLETRRKAGLVAARQDWLNKLVGVFFLPGGNSFPEMVGIVTDVQIDDGSTGSIMLNLSNPVEESRCNYRVPHPAYPTESVSRWVFDYEVRLAPTAPNPQEGEAA